MENLDRLNTSINISVIGLGFVGLTTALGFAEKGYSVTGFDIDIKKQNSIREGIVPFFEPSLEDMLKNNYNTTFFLAEEITTSSRDADIIFLCVGTPMQSNGEADLQYIYSAISSIIDTLKENCTIVIKSTVPPSTTNNLIVPYLRNKGFTGHIANNPEFLREGYCVEDFMFPDRIVCGVENGNLYASNLLHQLYAPFNAPVHITTLNSAEFIKYLSNTMLATMISFSNEMSIIANQIGDIEIGKSFKILHEDKRLADSGISSYLYPGAGYGGYCLPKDTVALYKTAQNRGINLPMLGATIATNDNMPYINIDKIKQACANKSTSITILGLSFKPHSDDIRDTTSSKIISLLLEDGYTNINAYDPIAIDEFKKHYKFDIEYSNSLGDVIVIATAWPQFKEINFKNKKIVDLRYMLDLN